MALAWYDVDHYELEVLQQGGDPPDVAGFLALIARPAWHADAACKEHPEVDFFPGRGQDVRLAQLVCAGCLVRDECTAAGADELHGIWGGLSGKQRRHGEEFKAPSPRAVRPARAPRERLEVGPCAACGHHSTGDGNDRLTCGYCPRCYSAWRGAGRPEDREQFEAARRRRLASRAGDGAARGLNGADAA
jgi:WhiB family redox-sensing transcriptional regulator